MPVKCVVPNCNSGYISSKEKVSLFKIPADRLDVWIKNIPRKDRLLTLKDHVCEKHFQNSDIIREWVSADGATKIAYKFPRLRPGAVPTIFPDCPKYLNKNVAKRKLPAARILSDQCKITKKCRKDEIDNTQAGIEVNMIQSHSEVFEMLWSSPELLNLPTCSWGFHKLTLPESRHIVFVNIVLTSKPLQTPVIERQVTISENLTPQFYNSSSLISSETWKWNSQKLTSVENIREMLEEFSSVIFCSGGPTVAIYSESKVKTSISKIDCVTNRWRHKNCTQILTSKQFCDKCASISQNFDRQLRREKHSTRVILKSLPGNEMYHKYRKMQQTNIKTRQRKKIVESRLKMKLEDLKEKYDKDMKSCIIKKLEQLNLPTMQRSIISECFRLGNYKTKKGRRYTGDWLRNCLLINIKSPSCYNLIRNQNILPLPCPDTIRNYLRRVDVKCSLPNDIK